MFVKVQIIPVVLNILAQSGLACILTRQDNAIGDLTMSGKKLKKYTEHTKRAFKDALKVTKDQYSKFITLTYQHDQTVNAMTAKTDLTNFFKRLRFHSELFYIWCLEYQGNRKNKYVPHFHILINDTGLTEIEISKIWHRTVGSDDKCHLKYGCCVNHITDIDNLLSYMSKVEQKYVPKKHGYPGKWWYYSLNVSKIYHERKEMAGQFMNGNKCNFVLITDRARLIEHGIPYSPETLLEFFESGEFPLLFVIGKSSQHIYININEWMTFTTGSKAEEIAAQLAAEEMLKGWPSDEDRDDYV